MSLIKMSSIMMPEYYVRGKLNSRNINDLMDIVIKTHSSLFKDSDKPDWHELVGKKLHWPFHTPIEVAKNPSPPKGEKLKGKGIKTSGKGKKKATIFKAHEIIDGGHRFTVWRRLKQKEIEARVKDIPNFAQRFLEQYRTNAAHGLRLDKDARDNAVRIAHTVFKVSLTDLGKETGLDRSSIIRIIANKQRKEGPRSKKKGDLAAPAGSQGEMSVNGFIERVQTLHANFSRLQDGLASFLIANVTASGRSKLGAMVSTLKKLADIFEAPLKFTTGKGESKPITTNLAPGMS